MFKRLNQTSQGTLASSWGSRAALTGFLPALSLGFTSFLILMDAGFQSMKTALKWESESCTGTAGLGRSKV